NRLTSTTGGATTNSQWDINAPLPELATEQDTSGNLLRRYLYGTAITPLSLTTPTGTSYYHYDTLGSVTNLTSNTGTTQWTYTYEPFGAFRNQPTKNDPNAPVNPVQFTGQYNDAATNLYNLRARQYDAATGRLLSSDPAEPPLTSPATATYVYAGDQPTVM